MPQIYAKSKDFSIFCFFALYDLFSCDLSHYNFHANLSFTKTFASKNALFEVEILFGKFSFARIWFCATLRLLGEGFLILIFPIYFLISCIIYHYRTYILYLISKFALIPTINIIFLIILLVYQN